MKKVLASAIAALLFCAAAITVNADWSNTIALAVIGNDLYTVEKSGALYRTDLSSGKWVQVGKSEFANTRFMFASASTLFTIEKDGSLYRVSPSDGSWSRIGKEGDWKNTINGVAVGENLYTVESGGELYVTNTTSGEWRQLGKAEYQRTKFIVGGSGVLYTIESNGTLYEVSPSNGGWRQVGKSSEWGKTMRAYMHGGKLYTVETNGAFYVTDLEKRSISADRQARLRPHQVFICRRFVRLHDRERRQALPHRSIRRKLG
jgi:hypothetical protein